MTGEAGGQKLWRGARSAPDARASAATMAPHDPMPQARRRLLGICLLLAIGQFSLNTSVWMLTGLLKPIATDFGISVGSAGQVISIFTIVYAISAPILAAATARMNRRPLLVIALALSAGANLLSIWAPNFGLLLLSRAIAGAADGLYGATAVAAVLSLAPEESRGRYLALLNSGLMLAMLIGVPASTWLGSTFGWRSTFLAVALFTSTGAVGLLVLLPRIEIAMGAGLRDRLAILTTRGAGPTLLVGSLSYFGMFTIFSYIAPILAATAGIAPSEMGTILLAFGVSAIVGNWCGGQAADRFQPRRTLIASLCLLAPLLAMMPYLAQTKLAAAVLLFIWGTLHYSGISPLQMLIARLAPANAGVAVALMNSAIYAGVSAGALMGGLFIDHLPLLAIGFIGALVKLAALAVLLFAVPRSESLRQPHPSREKE